MYCICPGKGKNKKTTQQSRIERERYGEEHANNMLHNETMESVADTVFPSHDRGEIEKQVYG